MFISLTKLKLLEFNNGIHDSDMTSMQGSCFLKSCQCHVRDPLIVRLLMTQHLLHQLSIIVEAMLLGQTLLLTVRLL
jgi:hypothetical protein